VSFVEKLCLSHWVYYWRFYCIFLSSPLVAPQADRRRRKAWLHSLPNLCQVSECAKSHCKYRNL